MLNGETKSTVKRLTNYFWSAGITNPVDYIEQISYLFFLKMLEENDDYQAKVSAKAGTPFKSIFEGEKKKYRWSEWHHKTGRELLTFVRDEVFTFMRDIGSRNPLAGGLFRATGDVVYRGCCTGGVEDNAEDVLQGVGGIVCYWYDYMLQQRGDRKA